MQLNPSDDNVRVAVFGRQVQQFLESDLGEYLALRAQQQSEAAIRELKQLDPFDPDLSRKVATIHQKLRIAENFIDWVAEVVDRGLQATEQLREDA